MYQFVRVRRYTDAQLICHGLLLYNFVKRAPRTILRNPHFLVFENDEIVAWIGCTRRSTAVYEIRHLTVLPAARRRGIGQAALSFMLDQLRERGVAYCYAHIQEDNVASQELFLKNGFILLREGPVQKYSRPLQEGL